MSMLKEERKALRDEFERIYGIRLREDDELLPIIQFITEAAKLAELNTTASKKLLEEMKGASDKLFSDSTNDYKKLLEHAAKSLQISTTDSRNLILTTKKDLDGLPKIVKDFRDALSTLKIPENVTLKRISFDDSTMSFLWRYFTISLGVIIIIIASAGWWGYTLNEEMLIMKKQYNTEWNEWLLKYYKQLSKDAPKQSRRFIDKNPMPE